MKWKKKPNWFYLFVHLSAKFRIVKICLEEVYDCHNPIFIHGIFSGVDTQNGTARTELAWFDEASPHQILPWRSSGTHFPRFDQVWLGLTKFD